MHLPAQVKGILSFCDLSNPIAILIPTLNRSEIIQPMLPNPVNPLSPYISEITWIEVATKKQNESNIFSIAFLELCELPGIFFVHPEAVSRVSR